jgi:nucleoside-diphosphate-sugar epimerase
MQTILGSGGVIGNGLIVELKKYTDKIHAVSRTGISGHPHAEGARADLLDANSVKKALKGSEVAYLVAGLQYNSRIWEEQWPVVMWNTIDACKHNGCKLVFFDNVYLYGLVDGPMTESTPARPVSRKGRVRARLADMVMEESARGDLRALIARAADFYGPGATNTFVHPMVFMKLLNGGKAAWLCNDSVPHSMIYTPDAVRGTALLGNTAEAYGEVWHLPVHPDTPTGGEFIRMVAGELGVEARWQVFKPWMLRMAGVFNPVVRESMEMLYQNRYPYIVDSSKFSGRFFAAAPYMEGVAQTCASVKNTAS